MLLRSAGLRTQFLRRLTRAAVQRGSTSRRSPWSKPVDHLQNAPKQITRYGDQFPPQPRWPQHYGVRAHGVHQARRAQARDFSRRRFDRRVVAAARRQYHGQGSRTRVPVAEAAGDRRICDRRGNRAAEKINPSYVSRVLRLTLVPDIVEAILDGLQPAAMTLVVLMRPFEVGWDKRQIAIDLTPGTSKSD
jgi:hypothetical protein